jgi:uncharacterized protein involved in exopolysaccharide biosynthesis
LHDQAKQADDFGFMVMMARQLWAARRTLFWTVAATMTVALCYALFAQPWYRSEVLLAPSRSDSGSSLTSQLATSPGLAAIAGLAGVNFQPAGSAEAVAVLRSRDFARHFIEDHSLTDSLLAKQSLFFGWRPRGSTSADRDIRDAIRVFDESLLSVTEDKKTGFVTIAMDWTDPQTAADWANELVNRVNAQMRNRTLTEAELNKQYLEKELAAANVVALQQQISQLLQYEIQRIMLARGHNEYAFRVIDKGQAPERRLRPKRLLSLVMGLAGGLALGSLIVYLRLAFQGATAPSPD